MLCAKLMLLKINQSIPASINAMVDSTQISTQRGHLYLNVVTSTDKIKYSGILHAKPKYITYHAETNFSAVKKTMMMLPPIRNLAV